VSERGRNTYKTLEVLGPEHEFSVVNDELKALPIVDRVIKDFHGRIVNFVEQPSFTFGKELQLHVMEIKPNEPFKSPVEFEETMHQAVLSMNEFLQRKYKAGLLGMGMHPLLKLAETGVWPHRDRKFYQAMDKVFDLKQHGWLNIQGFQLNLSYRNEREGVLLHNYLANVCAYLPAIAASSPIYEGHFGEEVDNRLHFYALNQKEVPSVTGDVVPEHVSSFGQYQKEIIGKYSLDLVRAGADRAIVGKEWINSRGVIFRFDRRALEIRVMDEQECVKSDVALSCFIRALARGLMTEKTELLSHEVLVKDYNAIVTDGLDARVQRPQGPTARQVCRDFLRSAGENATEEEKKYLPLIEKRVQRGSLSDVIRERVKSKSQKTDFEEAIVGVYSKLIRSLINNEPYF
jgi:gamma-glutamyl:cysteine ligase YbdK (ATP-grasp superfamily)